ncbi:MAG: rhomboid family intramembrane serine protease [Fimbriimonadaceae bacterium]|nr:rhomboid family intramembrane serine protease [Fimbriimonadaceae bacterium]
MAVRSRVPRAVLALLVVNLVGALAASIDPAVSSELGFDPSAPSVVSATASLILHANLAHLLGNLVFLAAVGPAVEFASSSWRLVSLYLLGGFAGVAAHFVVARATGDHSVLLGASAGIAAIAGFAALRYARVRVPLAPGLAVQVAWIAMAWVALQALGGSLAFGRFGGTSYVGHLTGFLVGLATAFLTRAPGEESREFGHSVLDVMNHRGPGAVLAATQRHLEDHPGDVKGLWAKAEALETLGEADERVRTIAEIAGKGQGEDAVRAARILASEGRAAVLPSILRIRLAQQAEHAGTASAILKSVTEGEVDDPQRPEALLALAEVQEGSEREATLRTLQTEFALHGATEVARKRGLLP